MRRVCQRIALRLIGGKVRRHRPPESRPAEPSPVQKPSWPIKPGHAVPVGGLVLDTFEPWGPGR